MTELASVSKGEVKADIKFEGGKLIVSAKYDGMGADAEIKVSLDSAYVIDKLKEAIPGTVDDAVLELLKSALVK